MDRLPFGLEIQDIAALADIINEKELGEIRLSDTESGEKLIIKGKCPPPPPPMPPAGFPAPETAAPAFQKAPEAAPAEKMPAGNVVTSPIVGTYYSSPSPDKPPFVKVGQKVKKGDTLMIIESMKLMNEVQSAFDGTVKEILAENGQAVEFDQPIMIIG